MRFEYEHECFRNGNYVMQGMVVPMEKVRPSVRCGICKKFYTIGRVDVLERVKGNEDGREQI